MSPTSSAPRSRVSAISARHGIIQNTIRPSDHLLGSYTSQIFWKGDPGIENFTIKFLTEDVMKKWYNTLIEQKSRWADVGSTSASNRPSTSATEFTYLAGQALENPYHLKSEEEDGDSLDGNTIVSPDSYASYPSESSWTQSQTSLRTRTNTNESGPTSAPGSGRMAPPRFAPGSIPGPQLFLRTGNSPASPAPNFAESYFSPTEESPMSGRSSAAGGMYFNSQPAGHERYTAPLPYRSGSREAMNAYAQAQAARAPSRGGGYPQGTPAPPGSSSGNRNRSVSSPSIPDQRRVLNSARPPMPEGPIPSHLHQQAASIRGQTNSPHLSNGIDERMGSPSSQFGRERSNTRPYPNPNDGRFTPTSTGSRSITPVAHNAISPPLGSATPTMADQQMLPPPSQLKVKVHATSANQTLTLVVSSNITYASLRDRIDAKLTRSTNLSLTDKGNNQVKLKYLDEEDLITIANDEDVQMAFETWREQQGDGLVGMGEITLFAQ